MLSACRRALDRKYGFSHRVNLWLYKIVLLPRTLHAAVIWWLRVQKLETKVQLKSLQVHFFRAAMGNMRATLADELDVALGVSRRY